MVGGTPKPFACTNEGCTMTFTNEDHLNVHQRKHEMVLSLGIKSGSAVADQTPTPTRFLRNCEEVGLFQDLQNVNPFEETFKRAVEMVKTGSLPVPDLPEDDTLHTPHVFPHIPEENVSCIYSTQMLKIDKIRLNTENNIDRNLELTVESMDTTTNDKFITVCTNNKESVLTISTSGDSSDHIYALTEMNSDKNPTILINDKPNISINKSVDHVYALHSDKDNCDLDVNESKKSESVVRDKKITKNRKYFNKGAVNLKPIANNISAKVKLQQILQTKQIKSAELKNNVAQSVILVQGLKIANSDKIISSNVTELALVNNMIPVLHTASSELPILPKLNSINVSSITKNTAVHPAVKIVKSTINNSKPIKNNINSNDTRKLDMLERNRAAATRCRARKKMWIGSLENKYYTVCKEKDELQKENANLRNEIQHLKTLLLAHKDCPVTKAMNLGQNIPIGPPRIVTIQVPAINEEVQNEVIVENADSKMKSIEIKPENISVSNKKKPSVIVLNDSIMT